MNYKLPLLLLFVLVFSVSLVVASSRTDTFSSNSSIALFGEGVVWSSGNVSFKGEESLQGLNVSENNAQVISLSEAASISGLANDGTYLYVNDGGARIKVALFNGSVISTHTISGLTSENNDMAHNGRFLFSRVGGTIYKLNLVLNTSAAVTIDSGYALPTGAGWQTGNIVDMPDGRVGAISTSASNPFYLRLYNVSENGTSFSWSEDIYINTSWNTDNHGIVSDGDSLLLISHLEGHRVFSLIDANLTHADSWNLRPSGIGNPTYITSDHVGKKIIVGDYHDRDFTIYAGSTSRANFTSTPTQLVGTLLNITNVSWISSGTSGGSTIRVEVSADNGSNWYNAVNGQPLGVAFGGENGTLVYSVIFTTSSGVNMSVDSVQISWEEDAYVTTLQSPQSITYYDSSIFFNISGNRNGSAVGTFDFGVSNFTLPSIGGSTFAFTNSSFADGNHTFTYYASDLLSNQTSNGSITFAIYTSDADGDGVLDLNDTLVGNESSVLGGISGLNLSISGNSSRGSFLGRQDLRFDAGNLLLNFSYNFSAGVLNLSKIRIEQGSGYIFLNFSGQLQGNKTVYLAVDDYDHLCVKDAEIGSILEVSDSCDGANETNFDLCLSENVSVNGISCSNNGSVFRFDNLQHSALKGSYDSQSESSGGGSSIRYGSSSKKEISGEGVIRRNDSRVICSSSWVCSSWSFCSADFTQQRECIMEQDGCALTEDKPIEERECPPILFDVLVELEDAKLSPWEALEFFVDLKEVNQNELLDIVVLYEILQSGEVVHSESETLAIPGTIRYEKKLDAALPRGDFDLRVTLNYGESQTASSLHPFKIVGLGIVYVGLGVLIFLAVIGFFAYNLYLLRKDEDELVRLKKKK